MGVGSDRNAEHHLFQVGFFYESHRPIWPHTYAIQLRAFHQSYADQGIDDLGNTGGLE
jgi:hypothetical protein